MNEHEKSDRHKESVLKQAAYSSATDVGAQLSVELSKEQKAKDTSIYNATHGAGLLVTHYNSLRHDSQFNFFTIVCFNNYLA